MIAFVQVAYVDGPPDADASTTRRAGVVAHHRGLGNDRLGDGLHSDVTDNRGRLVKQHEIDVLDADTGRLRGIFQYSDDPWDILHGPLDSGRHGGAGRQKFWGAIVTNPGYGSFRGRVAYVYTDDDAHRDSCHETGLAVLLRIRLNRVSLGSLS